MSGVWLSRSLGLQPEQLGRAVPFFLIYFLLFTALTLADAVAVSLFASRIGADRLPAWYAATAVLSLLMIGVYLTRVTQQNSVAIFGYLLATIATMFTVAWGIQQFSPGVAPLGMLFVTREIALTMVLMHFGTFLQNFFLRTELNRILPVIYAGGRVGGILAGGVVGWLAQQFGTVNLIPLVVFLIVIAWLGILRVHRTTEQCDEPNDEPGDVPNGPLDGGLNNGNSLAEDADASGAGVNATIRSSVAKFLKQVATIPLLGWITVTTLLFVACRWFLAYQYTAYFEIHFEDDVALAAFLGRYTQAALSVSLFLQLFLVTRIVERIGVPATHLLYSVLVMFGLVANTIASGLPIAVLSRFLETELRFGLRNPVNQMIVNRFSKRMRIAVRGWSLGWLIPIATLSASAMIAGLIHLGGSACVSIVGSVLGAGFVIASVRLGRAYQHFGSTDHPQRVGEVN